MLRSKRIDHLTPTLNISMILMCLHGDLNNPVNWQSTHLIITNYSLWIWNAMGQCQVDKQKFLPNRTASNMSELLYVFEQAFFVHKTEFKDFRNCLQSYLTTTAKMDRKYWQINLWWCWHKSMTKNYGNNVWIVKEEMNALCKALYVNTCSLNHLSSSYRSIHEFPGLPCNFVPS